MSGYALLFVLLAALSGLGLLLWPGQGRGGSVRSADVARVWRRRGR